MDSEKPIKRPPANHMEKRRIGWFSFEWVGVETFFNDDGTISHCLVTRRNDDHSIKSVTREEAK